MGYYDSVGCIDIHSDIAKAIIAAHNAWSKSLIKSMTSEEHQSNDAIMQHIRHSVTVAHVPELLAAFAETAETVAQNPMREIDPAETPLNGTSTTGVRFRCANGHHPRIEPLKFLVTGCPVCYAEPAAEPQHRTPSNNSAVELAYHAAAVAVFGAAESGVRVESADFISRRWWTVDIAAEIDGAKIVIEYDGGYWHADRVEVDTRKSRDLLAAGYLIVRLRDQGLPSLGINDPRYAEITVTTSKNRRPERIVRAISEWAANVKEAA